MTLSLASDRRGASGRTGERRATLIGVAEARSLSTVRRAASTGHRAQATRLAAAAVVREAERLALEGAVADEGADVLLAAADGQDHALEWALEACTDAVARYPGSLAARRAVQLLHVALEATVLALDPSVVTVRD